MVQVVFCERGARAARVNTMFLVATVDDASIAWVNGGASRMLSNPWMDWH